jgi:hypothetical protein
MGRNMYEIYYIKLAFLPSKSAFFLFPIFMIDKEIQRNIQRFKVMTSGKFSKKKTVYFQPNYSAFFSLRTCRNRRCFYFLTLLAVTVAALCSFCRGNLCTDVGDTKHDVDCPTPPTAPCIVVR